jgi:hypothetical protein
MNPTAVGHLGLTRDAGSPVACCRPVGAAEESGMVIGGGLIIVIAAVVVAIMLSKRDK